MAWAKHDRVATAAAYRTGEFTDKQRRSWIGFKTTGGHYERLYGPDKVARREQAYVLWNGCCRVCGILVLINMEELDHIIPYGRGGDDQLVNMQFLCRACHNKKHGRYPRWSKR